MAFLFLIFLNLYFSDMDIRQNRLEKIARLDAILQKYPAATELLDADTKNMLDIFRKGKTKINPPQPETPNNYQNMVVDVAGKADFKAKGEVLGYVKDAKTDLDSLASDNSLLVKELLMEELQNAFKEGFSKKIPLATIIFENIMQAVGVLFSDNDNLNDTAAKVAAIIKKNGFEPFDTEAELFEHYKAHKAFYDNKKFAASEMTSAIPKLSDFIRNAKDKLATPIKNEPDILTFIAEVRKRTGQLRTGLSPHQNATFLVEKEKVRAAWSALWAQDKDGVIFGDLLLAIDQMQGDFVPAKVFVPTIFATLDTQFSELALRGKAKACFYCLFVQNLGSGTDWAQEVVSNQYSPEQAFKTALQAWAGRSAAKINGVMTKAKPVLLDELTELAMQPNIRKADNPLQAYLVDKWLGIFPEQGTALDSALMTELSKILTETTHKSLEESPIREQYALFLKNAQCFVELDTLVGLVVQPETDSLVLEKQYVEIWNKWMEQTKNTVAAHQYSAFYVDRLKNNLPIAFQSQISGQELACFWLDKLFPLLVADKEGCLTKEQLLAHWKTAATIADTVFLEQKFELASAVLKGKMSDFISQMPKTLPAQAELTNALNASAKLAPKVITAKVQKIGKEESPSNEGLVIDCPNFCLKDKGNADLQIMWKGELKVPAKWSKNYILSHDGQKRFFVEADFNKIEFIHEQSTGAGFGDFKVTKQGISIPKPEDKATGLFQWAEISTEIELPSLEISTAAGGLTTIRKAVGSAGAAVAGGTGILTTVVDVATWNIYAKSAAVLVAAGGAAAGIWASDTNEAGRTIPIPAKKITITFTMYFSCEPDPIGLNTMQAALFPYCVGKYGGAKKDFEVPFGVTSSSQSIHCVNPTIKKNKK